MSGAITLTSPCGNASPARRIAGRDDGSGWLDLVGILADKISAPLPRRRDVHSPRLRTDREPQISRFVKKMSIFPKTVRSRLRTARNKTVRIPRLQHALLFIHSIGRGIRIQNQLAYRQ